MAEDQKTDMQFGAQLEPDLFWEQHRQKIMVAGLAVLAVVAAAFLWHRRKIELAESASASLATAYDSAALERVIQTYPGQPVVPIALLRLADVQFRSGQYAEAAAAYQKFLAQFSSHSLANLAKLGMAGCEEAQGNFESAKARYEQLVISDTSGHTTLTAKMGAARCAEALGQTQQARQLYEELLAIGKGSPWQAAAYLRWQLLARDITPVATNPPTASVATSPAPAAVQP